MTNDSGRRMRTRSLSSDRPLAAAQKMQAVEPTAAPVTYDSLQGEQSSSIDRRLTIDDLRIDDLLDDYRNRPINRQSKILNRQFGCPLDSQRVGRRHGCLTGGRGRVSTGFPINQLF